MELVTPSLLQLRRHVALKLGAGTAAGASVPARDIERPGAAIDESLDRELVPRVGESARRREEGAVVVQERTEAHATRRKRANAKDGRELLEERRQAGIRHTPIMPSTASTKHAVNAIGASHARERMPQPRMRAGRWKRRRVSTSCSMPT